MVRSARWVRRLRVGVVVGMFGGAMQFSGCMDSDIMKRFRQGYAPGLIEGLTTALGTPGNAEAGLRRTATAFAQGLGAVVQPRTQVTPQRRLEFRQLRFIGRRGWARGRAGSSRVREVR